MNAHEMIPLSLPDIMSMLWRRRRLIGTAGAIGLVGAFVLALILPSTYVAEGQVVVRAEASLSADEDKAFYSTAVNDAVVTTEREVLVAKGLVARVADAIHGPDTVSMTKRLKNTFYELTDKLGMSLGPDPAEAERLAKADHLEEVTKAITTAAEKGSSVISVRAKASDPQTSSDMATRLLSLYMADRLVSQRSSGTNVETALRGRLEQTRNEIAATEKKVAALMLQPGPLENTEIPSAGRDLSLVGSKLSTAQGELALKKAALQAGEAVRAASQGNARQFVETMNKAPSPLSIQLAVEKDKLAHLSAIYGPNQPERLASQTAVNSMEALFKAEAERIMAQLRADVAVADQTVKSFTTQYADLRKHTSNNSPSVLNLDRERDTLTNLRKIAGTIEDRLIAVAAQPSDAYARVLSWPIVPVRPAFPDKTLFAAIGLLAGLMLSAGTVLFKEFKRRSVPAMTGHAGTLPGQLLGSLPHMSSRRLKTDALEINYWGIALQVEELCKREGRQVLTVTSGLQNEGKTTVAENVALTLTKFGKKVLLIDCDLHGQSLADGDLKVSDLDDRLLDVRIRPDSGLHVLSAHDGGADPISTLRSVQFANMIDDAREEYDIILCDTPPVLAVPDALVVARSSDGILLVMEYRTALNMDLSNEISRRLSTLDSPVCGIVLTKTASNDMSFSSYSGYEKRKTALPRRLALT